MKHVVLSIGLVALLAGCSGAAQDAVARSAAKAAVRPVLAERFPGIPLEPATDCIIDNASADQIFALAASGVSGPSPQTAQIVTEIAAKPETIRCLAVEGAPALLQGFL